MADVEPIKLKMEMMKMEISKDVCESIKDMIGYICETESEDFEENFQDLPLVEEVSQEDYDIEVAIYNKMLTEDDYRIHDQIDKIATLVTGHVYCDAIKVSNYLKGI